MLRYVTLYCVTICYVALRYVTISCVTLGYVVLHVHYVMLHYMLRNVAFCYIVALRFVTLCYVMLSFAQRYCNALIISRKCTCNSKKGMFFELFVFPNVLYINIT